ncbi:MAG: metal ABC transporter permease, partial [Verrucomicrobiae bacterium]|nr:metal ABC transporter permease [Verrucomicrobiae bacterium]
LGIGLHGALGRSDNDVRSLLWGNLNFCSWADVAAMAVGSGAGLAFVCLFFKELQAILFSRSDAETTGVRVGLVWTIFLVVTAITLTVNFQTVGGLMIYSLLSNPAITAFQLTRGCLRVILLSGFLGLVSGLGGFLIAAATDLPTGAVIVLLSSALVGIATLWRRFRRS